jgi:hypothetical protein
MAASSRVGLRHGAFALAALSLVPALGAGETAVRVEASSGVPVRVWSGRVDRLLASGDLVERLTRDDTMIPGRRHERLAQHHQGVPVFGGELIRQIDASGTLTVFGTLYEGIDLSVAASLSPVGAEARLAARGGRPFGSRGGPELVILPLEAGGYRLAYRIRTFFEESFEIRQSFLDATNRRGSSGVQRHPDTGRGRGHGRAGRPEEDQRCTLRWRLRDERPAPAPGDFQL